MVMAAKITRPTYKIAI